MKFFSGFSLKNESELFDFWLDSSRYSVAGFSYGAIKAFEYVLNSKSRVDRLILISPAYFCNKRDRYKQLQLKLYSNNREKYMKYFLNNLSNTTDMSRYLSQSNIDELNQLLHYKWDKRRFELLKKRGITIEVVLGEKDNIIDTKEALKFFKPLATTYLIKDVGHVLN